MRLVERWVASVGLDPRKFAHAFDAPDEGDPHLPPQGNLRVVQLLLGHTRMKAHYLGVGADDALAIAEKTDV